MTLFSPASEVEAAEVVREAADAGRPVEIVGGGTKRGVGRPVNAAITLSTAGLSGIVAYAPAEMVITARAGTPLAVVEAELARSRQRLAFEPGDHRRLLGSNGEPTIGAVAAANLSGPRRHVAGAARDSLLGLRFVNGTGEILHSGGRVMKNVTGLDLVKLLAGSWGTLALLTEVTFKVQPVPETAATFAVRGLLDDAAATVMAHAMASPLDVSGAAHLPEPTARLVGRGVLGSDPATLLRLEGFADSVRLRLEKLKALLGAAGETEVLGEQETAAVWRDIRDCAPFADGTQKLVWRISLKPSEGHAFGLALRREALASTIYDWQGGLVWARMEEGAEAELVRRLVRAHGGGHATLWRGDDPTPFEPQSPALAALSARVKAAFDPHGIFNPGRFGATAP